MKSGAVAVMDVLGFKGIWQRYDARGVLRAMRDLEKMVSAAGRLTNQLEGDVWPPDIRPTYRFRFMSDTLFVGCWLQTRLAATERISTAAALFLLCRLTSRLLATATAAGWPLRGCVTAGQLDVLRNFVIGPAVDEAAGLANRANGAFVWLSTTSVPLYRVVDPEFSRSPTHVVYPYDVPIKGTSSIRTAVVNPRGDETHEASERDFAELLKLFKSDRPDVVEKQRHTQEFFRHILHLGLPEGRALNDSGQAPDQIREDEPNEGMHPAAPKPGGG